MKKLEFLDIVGQIDEKYVTEAKMKQERGAGIMKVHKGFNVFKGVISAAVTIFIIGIAFVWVLVGRDILDTQKDGNEDRQEIEITAENAKQYYEKGYNALINADYFTIDQTQENQIADYYEKHRISLEFADDGKAPVYLITKSSTRDKNGETVDKSEIFGKGKYEYTKNLQDLGATAKEQENAVDKKDAFESVSIQYLFDPNSEDQSLKYFWETEFAIKKDDGNYVVYLETEDPCEFFEIFETEVDDYALVFEEFKGYVYVSFNKYGDLVGLGYEMSYETNGTQITVGPHYEFQIHDHLDISEPDWLDDYYGETTVNPEEYIAYTFSGNNGEGVLKIERLGSKLPGPIKGKVKFEASKTEKLSNGESIVITVIVDEEFEQLGYTLTHDTFSVTVEGLISESDIPSDGVITTAKQLAAVLNFGNSKTDYKVEAKELDMTGRTWKGLYDYQGTFDFGGCVLKNVSSPLFMSVNGATVKNLVISESEISYGLEEIEKTVDPKTGELSNPYFGTVICYANNVTVENVTIDKSVSINTDVWKDGNVQGGVIGLVEGTRVLIKDCTFNGSYRTVTWFANVGGIVGQVVSTDKNAVNVSSPENSTVLIINCASNGTVEQNEGSEYTLPTNSVAGIVGSISNCAVVRCYNGGDVIASYSNRTAGIVGYAVDTTVISYCINAGEVRGHTECGGIVGRTASDSSILIHGCINIGAVKDFYSQQKAKLGGIVGMARYEQNIKYCFNLTSACEIFANGYDYKNGEHVIDPQDNSTYGMVTFANSMNRTSAKAIVDAIEKLCPGVFKYENETVTFK